MIKQLKAVIVGTVLFAFVATIVVLPGSALTAEAATGTTESSEVIPFDAMTVTVRRLPNTYFAAVTGFLDPETVELPATIEIAVPEGAQLIWFGEPSDDRPIESAPRFENPDMRTVDGFDIYTATLQHEHQAQIEYNLFFNPVAEAGDGSYILHMEYTPLTDLQALRFITNLPPGNQIVIDDDVEFYGLNGEGERQYGRTFWDVGAGRMITTNISYTAPGGMGTPNESRVSDGIIVAAVSTLVGVVAVLGIVLVAKRRRAANEEY
ncbi:MAG: hypothetical protein FWC86_02005 [Coriobacteriia bacterium]|nr:hypothetical protein [Coriobacteriia bacterium]